MVDRILDTCFGAVIGTLMNFYFYGWWYVITGNDNNRILLGFFLTSVLIGAVCGWLLGPWIREKLYD